MTAIQEIRIKELIELLDHAVEQTEMKGCCHAVKDALEHVVQSGQDFIPEEFLRPANECYARRLLHKDPKGRYTALVMVWDKGQGTALHDHDNMWCVECVYRGRIKVVSYAHQGEKNGLHQFTPEQIVFAGPGEAGALIPPFDHHTIENCMDTPAVTLHIYGGEMTECSAFVPKEGGYELVRRQLKYTD